MIKVLPIQTSGLTVQKRNSGLVTTIQSGGPPRFGSTNATFAQIPVDKAQFHYSERDEMNLDEIRKEEEDKYGPRVDTTHATKREKDKAKIEKEYEKIEEKKNEELKELIQDEQRKDQYRQKLYEKDERKREQKRELNRLQLDGVIGDIKEERANNVTNAEINRLMENLDVFSDLPPQPEEGRSRRRIAKTSLPTSWDQVAQQLQSQGNQVVVVDSVADVPRGADYVLAQATETKKERKYATPQREIKTRTSADRSIALSDYVEQSPAQPVGHRTRARQAQQKPMSPTFIYHTPSRVRRRQVTRQLDFSATTPAEMPSRFVPQGFVRQ